MCMFFSIRSNSSFSHSTLKIPISMRYDASGKLGVRCKGCMQRTQACVAKTKFKIVWTKYWNTSAQLSHARVGEVHLSFPELPVSIQVTVDPSSLAPTCIELRSEAPPLLLINEVIHPDFIQIRSRHYTILWVKMLQIIDEKKTFLQNLQTN